MVSFTWKILQMWVRPTEGSYTNVVIDARWQCSGSEESNGILYVQDLANNCSFPMPEGQFTPYDQLTEQQVLGWCWANGVNKSEIEGLVAARVAAAANPPVIEPLLPWAAVNQIVNN